MSAISVSDLSVAYGHVQVVRNLQLDVVEGEFLVLLGPSGCGKSTLLNTIAGLIDPSSGAVHIGGRDVTWEEPKDRGIAMVFQSYALYPKMTVRGNLSFGLKVAGLPRADIEQRVRDAAEFLQIADLLDRRPSQLSGGQRQRVAIGRALVRKVDVFLFDEPLSNLDAKLRGELRVEIKRLHRDLGNTMIYVTHDQVEALTLADRIAVMKDGIVQQLAPPGEIYRRPKNLFVASFIGSPGMNFIDGTLRSSNGTAWFSGAGLEVPLDDYAFDGAPDQQARVVLGLRPEHISLDAAAASCPFSTNAKVDMVEPMGADTVIWCTLGEKLVSIRADGDSSVADGDELRVGLAPAKASLFEAGTGKRL